MANIVYKIHRVFNEPFEDEEDEWWVTCRVEDVAKGEMFTDDVPFKDFNSAYKFCRKFDSSIDSIEILVPTTRFFGEIQNHG